MKIRVFLSLSFLAFLLFPAIQCSAGTQISSTVAIPSQSSAEASLARNFGELPLSFEVNNGQADPQVRFLSRGSGYSLLLTDRDALLTLSSKSVTEAIRMQVAGARSGIRVTPAEKLPGTVNYLVGNDAAKWRSNIPTYARVKYEGVYPGVDLVYYGNQRNLEYDFVVAPNASAKPLRVRFSGAQRIRLSRNGDLAIIGKHGQIAFHKPVVYQLKQGVRQPVRGRFQLLGNNTVGFRLGGYDHERELVIDPVLAYSTYLGGSEADGVYGGQGAGAIAIAVDAAGDAYVVGGTESPDFPVTSGAFQTVNNGILYGENVYLNNAFITKFNPSGSALMYSTFLGGTSAEDGGNYNGTVATAIAIDPAGNAYVAGYTSDYNFPVTSNAFQRHFQGYSSNAFVTKLDATGSALIYSTYLGGTGNLLSEQTYGDYALGIAVDSTGSAYVAGTTFSADFPVTSNAFQKTNNAYNNDGSNLFVAKFNPAGSALDYSTYLGGSGIPLGEGTLNYGDTGSGIAIDKAGDAYVVGTALSRDYPVTPGAFQSMNKTPYDPSYAVGGTNVVISKLNPTGSALVYSTYLGGSTGDGANAIVLSPAGNVYVSGLAGSPDFPVTPHAFRKVNTNGDGFVTELNSAGSALVYSTFLGGGIANRIALDAFGSAYLTGGAGPNFPVTPDAFRKANHGNGDAFVSKLDPTGSSMLYSSYIGGGGGDTGNGIAVDWFGDAYITGNTCSTDFPVTGHAFQSTNVSGGCESFLSKFIVNTVTKTTLLSNNNSGKVGTTATFTATVTANTGTAIPTGSVVFTLDGTPQVTVALDSSGQAAYSNSSLAAGRYTITATYLGNSTTSGSIANLGQLIIGNPARITVASGREQTSVVGTPFAMRLVALVQDERGMPVPGATVDFSGAGLSFMGNPSVTDGNGRASVVATPTSVGPLTASASVAGVATPATFKLSATQP